MWHVNETLFTYDKNFNPIPLLAESHTRHRRGPAPHDHAAQGRQVPQRQGDDLGRRGAVAPALGPGRLARASALWKYVESVEAKDPYTVVISLKQPSALAHLRARPSRTPPIYPKESIEAAGEGQLKEFIGTGPYRFVEHRPDRHIKLARFKDYSARSEPPNGFGGKRTAYFDEILFLPVPDTAVRLAGVETGEYHHAHVRQAGLLRPHQGPARARVAHRQAARLGGGGPEPQAPAR